MLLANKSNARSSLLSVVAAVTLIAPFAGSPALANYGSTYRTPSPYRQGQVAYVPAGMVIPVTITSSISSQVARPGDQITGTINQHVYLGQTFIPAGSVVTGHITDADPAKRLARSGGIGLKFTSLRTPGGPDVPIAAHILGGIDKYKDVGSDESDYVKGETAGTKVKATLVDGAVGAGAGALLGTAVGAIAARRHGRGAGRGAWSGAAIGGGVGIANGLLIRKGHEVLIPSGTLVQLQLDAPASVPAPSYGAF